MSKATEILAKLREDTTDLPEDYLRDIAGMLRHRERLGQPVFVRDFDTEVLDAIADTLESVRIRVGKTHLSLNPET